MIENVIIKSLVGIAQQLEMDGHILDWYIFGSFLDSSEHANDIDILIIYKSNFSPKIVRNYLAEFFNYYPLDLLFMTVDEEKELNFIYGVKAKPLYI